MAFLRQQARDYGQFHVEFRLACDPKAGLTQAQFEDGLDHWFGGKLWRSNSTRLEIIGTDWSGGMFCTWHYPGLEGAAPVVYLGSEGQGLAPVALDLVRFVELLATGRIWGVYEGRFSDDEQPPAHAAFAAAASKLFGFTGRTAEAIQSEAAAAHPGFKAWIDSQTS